MGNKEVSVRIHKGHLLQTGKQAYRCLVTFYNEAYKKVSDNDFVAVEIDRELNRLYFVASNNNDGFKLISGENHKEFSKSISFTIYEKAEWNDVVGEYYLLKEKNCPDYFIDYSAKRGSK